jgi:hypothetical protein
MKTNCKNLYVSFFISAVLSFFISCREGVKEGNLFPKEKQIVFSDMHVGENLGAVISMKAVNNFLIVSERNLDTQVQLIDTKTGYLFGLTGEGPGRILQSADIIPIDDRHVGIYDIHISIHFP